MTRRYYLMMCETQSIDWLKKRAFEPVAGMTKLDVATIKLALLKKMMGISK